MERLDEIYALLLENNLLLKKVLAYFALSESRKGPDNVQDFMQNVLANLISNIK